ncbi:MAG TPA: hypothetical protein VEZ12_09220, partial [Herpetosiphonaceae bacterium]|nr:hypothetical protein [Herpetosiphonaceae bacterium]
LPRCSTVEGAGAAGASQNGTCAIGSGRLSGIVRAVEDLAPDERERLYILLTRYFANVTRMQFEQDLAEKDRVILLTDGLTGQIQGFSTLMQLHILVDDHPVVAFFSGDTIVERAYWGESVLSRSWARYVFQQAAQIRRAVPEPRVYWFLICSGYKTYRFLPTFFREFYPAYDRPALPIVKRTLDRLAWLKFPSEYDAERGVVRLRQATPLRPEVATITEHLLANPHVAFFVAANPGHVDGDELACLTEIIPENLTPAGRRMLLGG